MWIWGNTTPCADVEHDVANPHQRLTCTLPAGGGVDVTVWVVNGHVSAVTGTLSYEIP